MITVVEHIMKRYLGQKAQGLTEYALILALVVAIGVAVLGTDGTLGSAITNAFATVAGKINPTS